MDEEQPYVEEEFGILTDDDIYLDCILVRPTHTEDEDLRAVRVWVPRYPLTKSSVITCARQEVSGAGADGDVAHLVFDLRGTGYSEGQRDAQNFEMDLAGVRLWAEERFGDINLSFLGSPKGSEQVQQLPIRPGVAMETYYYRLAPGAEPRGPLVYLATYGNFSRADDARCVALAEAGYEVYGVEPLRYLLHASASDRLSPAALWQDMATYCRQLGANPWMVAMPVSAGLGLLWASGVQSIRGIVALGHAQVAFKPHHIFQTTNPHTFFLSRYVHKLPPRPLSLVQIDGHPLGGERDELAALYQTTSGPRDLRHTRVVSPDFLLERLQWLESPG